ncbi:MAG: Dephospho-CoA kinase [Brockia lithotrophica]|uniref:Dephospho-CoA kinase n=1 Tax=Brockia lithotrophica TaxID=933949 RepID=A0A2T5GAE8_9BACL|nr:MAG: Dephospho-CoA kinase [Brockia lithotrophica]
MLRVALTGGIAAGKSTVGRILAERGFPVLDADVVAREVLRPGEPLLESVVRRFGPEILLPDGTVDRRRLGALVFSDDAARRALEGLLHPEIRRRIRARLEALGRASPPPPAAVVLVPLLFEAAWESDFDWIATVEVPREVQLRRLLARDGLVEEEARARIRAQLSPEERIARAHVFFENGGTLEDLVRQVDAFVSALRRRTA